MIGGVCGVALASEGYLNDFVLDCGANPVLYAVSALETRSKPDKPHER